MKHAAINTNTFNVEIIQTFIIFINVEIRVIYLRSK